MARSPGSNLYGISTTGTRANLNDMVTGSTVAPGEQIIQYRANRKLNVTTTQDTHSAVQPQLTVRKGSVIDIVERIQIGSVIRGRLPYGGWISLHNTKIGVMYASCVDENDEYVHEVLI